MLLSQGLLQERGCLQTLHRARSCRNDCGRTEHLRGGLNIVVGTTFGLGSWIRGGKDGGPLDSCKNWNCSVTVTEKQCCFFVEWCASSRTQNRSSASYLFWNPPPTERKRSNPWKLMQLGAPQQNFREQLCSPLNVAHKNSWLVRPSYAISLDASLVNRRCILYPTGSCGLVATMWVFFVGSSLPPRGRLFSFSDCFTRIHLPLWHRICW